MKHLPKSFNQRFIITETTGTVAAARMMQRLLRHNESAIQQFLSPVKTTDGRYITGEATLNTWSDPRVFIETQLKRLLRAAIGLILIGAFFHWLLKDNLRLKLDYFIDENLPNENGQFDRIYKYNISKIPARVIDGCHIHNLGHASQLIQTEGINILTDPAFGDLQTLLYPSRTKPFGNDIDVCSLPEIDIIIISHNHRDHVDEHTLNLLQKRGMQPLILVPKGDRRFFEKLEFINVREMEWNAEITYTSPLTNKQITICSVPADHRSGRYGYDAHHSLVSGWIISPASRDEIIYYAGDTARLDDPRMLSVAMNIYMLNSQKVIPSETSPRKLPNIICLAPGGPNYTRRDMKNTHQSAVDSIAMSFRLAIALERVSYTAGRLITSKSWHKMIRTVFMHHRKYELGPDRFNENALIINKLMLYCAMDSKEVEHAMLKQQSKSAYHSLFNRRKDFIIHGMLEIKQYIADIYFCSSEKPRLGEVLIQHLKFNVFLPLINEILDTHTLYKPPVASIPDSKSETPNNTRYKR